MHVSEVLDIVGVSAERNVLTLAGVAQWTDHRPVNQRVASLIPSQGTCLGCRPSTQLGA